MIATSMLSHSVQAIKYTLKYLYKGSDQVTVTIEDNAEETDTNNEVEQFQNKQYVSAAEASWCQCQNEVADRKPTVNRLQLHLPGEQQCTLIPIRKMNQLSELSKLNEQNSLLSLSLITKISLHALCCTRKFLSTTHGIPNEGSGREERKF